MCYVHLRVHVFKTLSGNGDFENLVIGDMVDLIVRIF